MVASSLLIPESAPTSESRRQNETTPLGVGFMFLVGLDLIG